MPHYDITYPPMRQPSGAALLQMYEAARRASAMKPDSALLRSEEQAAAALEEWLWDHKEELLQARHTARFREALVQIQLRSDSCPEELADAQSDLAYVHTVATAALSSATK